MILHLKTSNRPNYFPTLSHSPTFLPASTSCVKYLGHCKQIHLLYVFFWTQRMTLIRKRMRRRRRMKVVKTGTHRRYRFYTICNSLHSQISILFHFQTQNHLYYVLWLSFHTNLYTYNYLDQYFVTTPFVNRDCSLQVLLSL